jgi:vancomycin permeability regulator SanA
MMDVHASQHRKAIDAPSVRNVDLVDVAGDFLGLVGVNSSTVDHGVYDDRNEIVVTGRRHCEEASLIDKAGILSKCGLEKQIRDKLFDQAAIVRENRSAS